MWQVLRTSTIHSSRLIKHIKTKKKKKVNTDNCVKVANYFDLSFLISTFNTLQKGVFHCMEKSHQNSMVLPSFPSFNQKLNNSSLLINCYTNEPVNLSLEQQCYWRKMFHINFPQKHNSEHGCSYMSKDNFSRLKIQQLHWLIFPAESSVWF